MVKGRRGSFKQAPDCWIWALMNTRYHDERRRDRLELFLADDDIIVPRRDTVRPRKGTF